MTYNTDRPIRTEGEARSSVYKWCVRLGQDPTRYTKLIEDIGKTLPSSPISEAALIDYVSHFGTVTANAEKFWAGYERDAWTQSAVWAVETVKHLAFLNGAGLAGATAVLGTGSATGLKMLAVVLALGLGLILAVLCMWIIGTGFEKRAFGLRHRLERVQKSQTWSDLTTAQSEPYTDRGEKWFDASLWIGWLSAGCAVCGLGLLIWAVA